MFVDFQFRDLNSSEELESYFMDRFTKIGRMEKAPFHVSVVFSYQKSVKKVQVRLKSKIYDLVASSEGEDFFACVDQAADRVLVQLKRRKGRFLDRKAS